MKSVILILLIFLVSHVYSQDTISPNPKMVADTITVLNYKFNIAQKYIVAMTKEIDEFSRKEEAAKGRVIHRTATQELIDVCLDQLNQYYLDCTTETVEYYLVDSLKYIEQIEALKSDTTLIGQHELKRLLRLVKAPSLLIR